MTKKVVLEFQGEFRFLSNFFLCSLTWDNIVWPHSEAAYQAAKTLNRAKRIEFSHLSPFESKRRGKQLMLRDDWDKVKIEIMAEILFAKFDQNPHLKQQLLTTGDVLLIEGNSWKDTFWGHSPVGSNIGSNHLGRLLMELRTLFQLELEYKGEISAGELLNVLNERALTLSNQEVGNNLLSF